MRHQTRDEFEQFLQRNITGQYGGAPMIFVSPPWTIVPCACGDINCRGWRVVTKITAACPTCGHPVPAASGSVPA
jgi:hypothetical protein